MMPGTIEGKVAIAVLQEQMKETKEEIRKVSDKLTTIDAKIDNLDQKYAGKLAERIIYGLVALIILAFMTYLIGLVFDNREQIEDGGKGDQTTTQVEPSQNPPPSSSFTPAGKPNSGAVSPQTKTNPTPTAPPTTSQDEGDRVLLKA